MSVRHQARRFQHRVLSTAFVTIVACCLAQAAAGDDAPAASRVRSSDRTFISLMDGATERSVTFRLLRTGSRPPIASSTSSQGIVGTACGPA